MKYTNPILSGFHPDPSICRVEKDYYMVHSSFEYFPGVPIFHSCDLIHWRQIGHCLTRKSQLNLEHVFSSGGIFAPTLRYNKGVFYMITTCVGGSGHFYVYTNDPKKEWSDPIYIEGTGFDPDLFFDEDGKVYFTRHSDDDKGICQWEIDLATGKLIGEGRRIWKGFEDKLCEGPHIYKIKGSYYLIAAEGGTHRGHMIVVGKSDNAQGPFQSCSQNPILTHRAEVANSIQATGHGDLIQAHDGSWWIVFLGIRQVGWGFHHLGRETFLAPVTWSEEGYPIINNNKPITIAMDCPTLSECKWLIDDGHDDFNCKQLGLNWNYRRNPIEENYSLTTKAGHLTLRGTSKTLDDYGCTFVGRRQEHFNCQVSALLDFSPQNNGQEAGIVAMMNENYHYEICVTVIDGQRFVVVRKQIGDMKYDVVRNVLLEDKIILTIKATPDKYEFGYRIRESNAVKIASGETKFLSSEVATGFTGVYFGMYATSNGGESVACANFDWFDYKIIIE